jgi:integrase/recombinase XerD
MLLSLSVISIRFDTEYFSLPITYDSRYILADQIHITMAGRRAKVFSQADVNDLLVFATCTRNPMRNRVIVLLSAKAGLRAGEIASLTWDMVRGPTGEINGIIELRDSAAKKSSGRTIPIHPELRAALVAWRRSSAKSEYVAESERGARHDGLQHRRVVQTGVQEHWPKRLLVAFGRRTFVTRAARIVHKAGGSLRDVQLLAGHRSIQTTQRYIDGDSDAQRKLVSLI